MHLPSQLCCLEHSQPLTADAAASPSALVCASGCRVPVVRSVPRFVALSNYASGFGLQWKTFRQTQLDSYTGTTISKDRLARCFGGSLDVVRGKSVLEVGCGAGRFTELLLAAGAHVFACDLSQAVEANYDNCHGSPNYFVCQADARRLPVVPHSFDFVLCIGVIQHTPSPEETIAALARYVKPGGMLVIDHYSHNYIQNFLQRNLRRLLIRLPASVAKPATLGMARALVPLHRFAWKKLAHRRGLWRLRARLVKHSPFIDYFELFPQLSDKLVAEWAILDTHDALTDYYKHLRSRDEIEESLRSCGFTDLEVSYGGNGVEARARMPVSDAAREAESKVGVEAGA
jgi:SAM-dependent methyltransferase